MLVAAARDLGFVAQVTADVVAKKRRAKCSFLIAKL